MISKIAKMLGYMKLSDIKIYPDYEKHKPGYSKMLEKLVHYICYDRFEQPIVVNESGYLVNGYTSYLIANELKHKWVKIKKLERS